MNPKHALCIAGLVGLTAASPTRAEDLAGQLAIGDKLEIYLLPQPGFFSRMFSALGLTSPPKPVSLTEAAVLGRDDVMVAQVPSEDPDMGDDWSLFAKVRPAEDEVVWYNIGKPSTRFWEIKLKDGVTISRVRKTAMQTFEGTIEGNPWFLRVDAPEKLAVEREIKPKLVGMKFWLDEFLFNYDETAQSTSRGGKRSNYSVLLDAIVTALPDELDEFGDDPEPFERFRQLRLAIRQAMPEDLVALRDLVEAKVARLEKVEPVDEDARAKADELYGQLLDELRKRTSDG